MGSILLILMLGIVAGDVSVDNSNNTESEVEDSFIAPIFSFFKPVDIEENAWNDAVDLHGPVNSNVSQEIPQPMIVIVREIIIEEDENEKPADLKFPGFAYFSEKESSVDEVNNILDLSWKDITGDYLASVLRSQDRPVTSLILSNSRINGLTSASFLPAETTLQKLIMDNCTVSLEAFTRLNSLRVLNLSNTGLSTFEWYPRLQDSLEVLDLSHNKLEEIRPEISALTNLRQLYLSHNKISSVTEYPLGMLHHLELVSLTMNSISNAVLTSLHNLQRVDLDWNFLRLCGQDLQLPSQVVSVKIASNPWRCDCGLLQTRDSHYIMDLEILRCANSVSYALCDNCKRYFLPFENYNLASNLTKDSINHLGCTGLVDQYYLLRDALVTLRDKEPEKLVQLAVILGLCALLITVAILICRDYFNKKKFNRKTWLSIHQRPFLKIPKLEKGQEVPYIKIDEPLFKA